MDGGAVQVDAQGRAGARGQRLPVAEVVEGLRRGVRYCRRRDDRGVVEVDAAGDGRLEQPQRALGAEPVLGDQVTAEFEALGQQGGAAGSQQLRPVQQQPAGDLGASEVDDAGTPDPGQPQVPGDGHAGRVQARQAGVAEPGEGQARPVQVRRLEELTLLDEQGAGHLGERQDELAGDPRLVQPQRRATARWLPGEQLGEQGRGHLGAAQVQRLPGRERPPHPFIDVHDGDRSAAAPTRRPPQRRAATPRISSRRARWPG